MVLDINAGVVYNSNPNPNETEPPLMRQVLRTELDVNTTCGAWIGFSRMIEAVKEGARVAEASRAAAPPTRRAEA